MDSRKSLDKEAISAILAEQAYVSDPQITMSIYLAMQLGKPLLIEGPAGVGKTEIAKVVSTSLGCELIRLQCYEGLDAHQALYEWNYQRQLLYLKLSEKTNQHIEEIEQDIFSRRFLLERPLLKAISQKDPAVLLIDEVDRADEEFESFLLELLSDWQISIPELGTIKAIHKPFVVVTSNRVRELSEALRRRCIYLYIDYPTFEKELAIIKGRIPDIDAELAEKITLFMKEVRQLRLQKIPGIVETLDWAAALTSMHLTHLDQTVVEETLGVVLKDWQDMRTTQMSLSELFEKTGIQPKLS